MPKPIEQLAATLLHKPQRVSVAPVSSVVDRIEQQLCYVEKPDKKQALISTLQHYDGATLVFSRTKHGADRIARIVTKAGIGCDAIHGDKSQTARQRALSNFKSGRTRVIVATDIAARGIDIDQLELVINYDLPDVAETYVHRIGRTGRAGRAGMALTFCSVEERPLLKDIEKLTGKKLHVIAPPTVVAH
jgi:ATP-dependent RNA helicase RhlE